MQLEAVHHELEHDVVPTTSGIEIWIEAVRVPQVPVGLPERLCPDLTDAMGLVGAIDGGEGLGVGAEIGGVGKVANAGAVWALSERIATDRTNIRTAAGGLVGERQGPPVAPTLSHSPALGQAQAAGAGRAAAQADGDSMTVFVDDDSGIEIAVALNLRGKGRVHTASKLGLDAISVGLADEDRRDRDGRIASAHGDGFVANVVHDDRSNRTSRLRIGHLLDECAISAVDERDLSGDCRTVRQR